MSRRFTVYSTTRREKAIFSLLFQSFYLFQEDTMNTILKTAIFVTALLMLGGCATKALTPEEQAFQDAQRSWHRADQLHDRREPLFMERSAPVEQLFRMVHGRQGLYQGSAKEHLVLNSHIVISRYDSRGGWLRRGCRRPAPYLLEPSSNLPAQAPLQHFFREKSRNATACYV